LQRHKEDINEFTKIVDITSTNNNNNVDVKSRIMFMLTQNRDIGYIINNSLSPENQTQQLQHSPVVQEVFNSFEVVS
jgi:hypothetical protein